MLICVKQQPRGRGGFASKTVSSGERTAVSEIVMAYEPIFGWLRNTSRMIKMRATSSSIGARKLLFLGIARVASDWWQVVGQSPVQAGAKVCTTVGSQQAARASSICSHRTSGWVCSRGIIIGVHADWNKDAGYTTCAVFRRPAYVCSHPHRYSGSSGQLFSRADGTKPSH